jgi:hypothetical protein
MTATVTPVTVPPGRYVANFRAALRQAARG